MKIEFFESANGFCFHMKPETMEEQASLVRFGMLSTGKVDSSMTSVYSDNTVQAWLEVRKNKRGTCVVPKRKGR